jgi:hypothetical protein
MGEVCGASYELYRCTHAYGVSNKYRSVHNTRIERLWYDVTQGFGAKWKDFFSDLENTANLDVDNSAHIWLLHHLFLPLVNQDAFQWATDWNNHKLQLHGERNQSPAEIYFFSMLTDGPRGITFPSGSARFVEGTRSQYVPDDSDHPPGSSNLDSNHAGASVSDAIPDLHAVHVDPPLCPLTLQQVEDLDFQLASDVVDLDSRRMVVRRQMWIDALQICNQFFQTAP